MMFHLLSNAIKFNKTKNGTIKITIQFDDQENILTYKISDSGIGMTNKMINYSLNLFGNVNIFEKTHFNKSGVGIGLSSCKQLAKAMGGSIHIESV